MTWSPGLRSCSLEKTPGPFQSTWPAITAGPRSPGVGPPVYHPAGKPPGGTCIDPSARRPRLIRAESTPIAAICRRTGDDLDRAATQSIFSGGDGFGDDATGLVKVDGATPAVVEAEGVTGTGVEIDGATKL